MPPHRLRSSRASAFPAALLALGVGAHACVESSTSTSSASASASAANTAGATGSGGGGAVDRNAVLRSLAEGVFLNTYEELVVAAEQLASTTTAYASSLDPTERAAAQAAWRATIAVWQRAELMQVGPAGVSGAVAGGEDLRDAIYSWPLVNRCRVDQETVEQSYTQGSALAAEPVNVRGLDALEYLLFHDDAGNACSSQNQINSSGSWTAIGEQGVAQRRADYAATAAALVAGHARDLRDRWADGFVTELAEAGRGSTTYETTQAAFNAVSDALFYLDKKTKDAKLAVPAGIMGCLEQTCPGDLESLHARASLEHVVENVRGFSLVFHGGEPGSDGLGFDDLLVSVGASDLAERMSESIAAALVAAAAIEEPSLTEALEADLASVQALHAAVREITTDAKTQLVGVLDLELPKAVEGDND